MSSIISARRAAFPESNVHLGHAYRTTTNVGTIRPVGFFPIVPGDDVFFAGGGLIRLLPIKLPFLSRFKVSLDYFFIPTKLYCKDLRDNNVSTFDPNNVTFPLISYSAVPIADHISYQTSDYGRPSQGMTPYIKGDMIPLTWVAEYANAHNPSGYSARYSARYNDDKDKECVLVEAGSFMQAAGLPAGFINTKRPSNLNPNANAENFSALRILGYVDVFRNYYANLQVPFAFFASEALMNQPSTDEQEALEPLYGLSSSYGRRQVIPCELLDSFIESAYNFKPTPNGPAFITSHFQNGNPGNPLRCTELWSGRDSGLFCRSFKPYYEETWINKSKYDTGPGSISVQVEDNQVLLTSIRSGSKILKFSELSVAGGYRYDDFLSVQFDVRTTSDTTIPVYLGSSHCYISSDPLYQLAPGMSENTGIGDGLGAIGGVASGQIAISPRRWSFHEFGEIMVLASIVPDVSFFSTIDPFLEKTTLNTLYYPSLDRLGFQPLLYRHIRQPYTFVIGHIPSTAVPSKSNEFIGFETTVDEDGSPMENSSQYFYKLAVGYQPAWSEYTRLQDRVSGDLASSLRPWVLTRTAGDQQFNPEYTTPEYVKTGSKPLQAAVYGDLNDLAFTPTPCYNTADYFVDSYAPYAAPTYVVDTYVRPADYNYLFENTRADAHNFIFELIYTCDIRRQKSKLNMPTFGL